MDRLHGDLVAEPHNEGPFPESAARRPELTSNEGDRSVVNAVRPERKAAWEFATGDEIVPGRTAQTLLGGGNRYEAYVAWNERLMSPTVVKILRPTAIEDARARRSMEREGHLLARLQHPGLTRLFDMDAAGERPFLEIEYIDGPRLSTLIRRHGRLNPEQAFPLGRHLASTLHYLHSEGVLHLDVKPSNIIMGPIPRLIDLSVAKAIARAPLTDGFVGTDAYMAPEQADPARWATIGTKSDTWGLGAALYQAAAKQLPYSRGRHDATGSARFPQLVEEPRLLDPLRHSPGLSEVVMSMLRRDPAERPTAPELFDRLDDLAARAGVGKVRFR
jgi:eukaryotic-like serine/threonine-protein kinase